MYSSELLETKKIVKIKFYMKVGIVEHIDSMHSLPGHQKCGVPHGHTYKVEVTMDGPVTNGMVIDFDILKRETRAILKAFDHVNLNTILQYPSCENMCAEIHKNLKERIGSNGEHKLSIRIWEGNGKWAEITE